jgi:hypothetical protein
VCRIAWIERRFVEVEVELGCERLWNETDPFPALLGRKVGNPLKKIDEWSGVQEDFQTTRL